MPRKKRDPKKTALAQAILNEYQPESVEDMQDALKDIFGPMFEAMLQGEMQDHLGYEKNDRQEKDGANRRNGYSTKTLKTSYGNVSIDVPRDRDSSFEPKVIPKRSTNVSGIEDKVLSMYAKGIVSVISQQRLKIFMDLKSLTRRYQISQTAYWYSSRNGKTGH